MRKAVVFGVFTLFLGLFFTTPNAYAIKAWAEKHGLECNVCHAGPGGGFLTPTGQDFLRRGFRLPDDEATKDWAKLFSINTKLRAHDSSAPGRNSTFEAHAFSIYTGGVLSKHWSYFTEMYLYENTGKISGSVNNDFGRGKLADAFLMFNSRPNKDVFTTVKFGQISSEQLLISWNVGPRFSETRPYVVNNSTVAPNSYRPFMRNFGIAINQHIKNLHAEFGVLNGTGTSSTNSLDTNESKDFYGSLDYDFGSSGASVGIYGYKGRGRITPASGAAWDNDFHRCGVFGRYTRGQFNFTGVATRGEEQLTADGKQAQNSGFLGEVDYFVSNKFSLFGRYDYFDPNTAIAKNHLSGPVFGFGYGLFDSGRLTFEYHKQGKYVASGAKPWEYRIELAYMF